MGGFVIEGCADELLQQTGRGVWLVLSTQMSNLSEAYGLREGYSGLKGLGSEIFVNLSAYQEMVPNRVSGLVLRTGSVDQLKLMLTLRPS